MVSNLPAHVLKRPEALLFVTVNMTGKYSEAHKPANLQGSGDAHPTAFPIIKDEGLEGKMTDKVFTVPGA